MVMVSGRMIELMVSPAGTMLALRIVSSLQLVKETIKMNLKAEYTIRLAKERINEINFSECGK
jgi:hypothetical protein